LPTGEQSLGNTVLVVDDNQAMRQALSRLFKAAGGFEICGEASNGAEAIKMVLQHKPGLVVLDLCMPGINGLETARQLQLMSHPPPIILYSMNAEEIVAKDAYESGVSALVSKADGIRTLINKARGILQQSAA
jgi:two-component system response regulator AlgR